MGYQYVPGESLDAERESLKDVALTKRLAAALRRLNPWLSDDNVPKAVRAVTHVAATSLIEASEKLYMILTYGIALEQDLGGGKKGQMVRFFDFEKPRNNGSQPAIEHPLAGRCRSGTLRWSRTLPPTWYQPPVRSSKRP